MKAIIVDWIDEKWEFVGRDVSAEEFVNNELRRIEIGMTDLKGDNILFRGNGFNYGDTADLYTLAKDRMTGTFYSSNPRRAAEYGKVSAYIIKSDAKILSYDELGSLIKNKNLSNVEVENVVRKNGFDGFKNRKGETVLLNDTAVEKISKSKLISIWKEARGNEAQENS